MDLDAVSWLLVVLAMVNVTCTVVLVTAAVQHRDWPALVDRAFVGVLLAFIALGAALLGLNRLGFLTLAPGQAVVVLAGGLGLVSLPSVVWVIQLIRGGFDAGEPMTQRDTLARIEAGVERAADAAHKAYDVANDVNNKLVAQGERTDARTKAIAKGEEVGDTT